MSLLSLSDVKTFLRKSGTSEDTLIQKLLDQAELTVAKLTGTTYKADDTAVVTETLDYSGGPAITFTQRPVLSVTSVVLTESTTTVPSDTYVMTNTGVRCLYGEFIRNMSLLTDAPTRYTVTYTGGYDADTLPVDHEIAIMRLVARNYEERAGHSSDSSENTSTSFKPYAEFIADLVQTLTVLGGD